jgi:hypothetical protein
MKIRTGVSVLLVFLLAAIVSGSDASGTRQSAGIYVTVDRSSHSVFFDFPSVSTSGGGVLEVETMLTTDLTSWIGGEALSSGRHAWSFKVESKDVWTIGPKPSRRNRKPLRFAFDVRKVETRREYLAAWFTPDASGDSVVLTVAVADHEGELVLRLKKRELPEGARTLDVRRLSDVRDGLLVAAAEIEHARRTRHHWSAILVTLGDAVLKGEKTGWIDDLDFNLEADWVKFIVRGQYPGERDKVMAFAETLKATEMSTVFDTVEVPQVGMRQDGKKERAFSLTARTVATDWTTAPAIVAKGGKSNAEKIAEEILALEARVAHYAPRAVRNLTEGRTLLLEAKRKAGALISRIQPSDPVTAANGLTKFELSLRVGGSGSMIVEFLRCLEEREEPLRIIPLRLSGTKFGPELYMRLVFYSYRPLNVRDGTFAEAVQARGDTPGFAARLKALRTALPTLGSRTFTPPDWKRDPFTRPAPQK